MSGIRRPAGPVRQLSLQTPPPLGNGTRRPLRRQRSEDPDLRVTSNSLQNEDSTRSRPSTGHHGVSNGRLHPVKVAWTDRRGQNLTAQKVEVVAKKYESQQRPTRPVILPDKEQILYTRQQLAERLRKAWRERPNLDIFLTHCNNNDDQGNVSPTSVVPTLANEITAKQNAILQESSSPVATLSNECFNKNINNCNDSSPAGQEEEQSPQANLNHIAIEVMPKTPNKENISENITVDPRNVPASVRRMQFKNSSTKGIMESFCIDNPPENRPPLQRALSAPTRRQEHRCEMGEEEEPGTDNGSSATSRRRLKSAVSRKKPRGRGDENTDEEKQKVGRRGVVRGEIVTMVSLMSPSESDNEQETFFTNIPRPPSWFQVTKVEKPKPSITHNVSPEINNIRKIPKSVSFQKDSSPVRNVSRPSSSVFPIRRNSLVLNLEREKRSTTVENSDDSAIKRRLIRTNNNNTSMIISNSENECHEQNKVESKAIEISTEPRLVKQEESQKSQVSDEVITNKKDEVKEEAQKENIPEFKTAKERECWELYQKMSNKGVNVSYDTILRGMLTPTEYRLRHKALMATFTASQTE